jgi:hypothetical protein
MRSDDFGEALADQRLEQINFHLPNGLRAA